MTLPTKLFDLIEKEAIDYGVQNPMISPYIAFRRGAIEWAGKAQGLADALEAFILWQGPTLENWPVMKQAREALARYKEVINEALSTGEGKVCEKCDRIVKEGWACEQCSYKV